MNSVFGANKEERLFSDMSDDQYYSRVNRFSQNMILVL
jgi:hypothetical protein